MDAKIARGVATNDRVSVANAVWESEDLREKLLCKVEKDINIESKGLSSRKNQSVLADTTPNNLININDSTVTSELKDRAPTVERLLRAVVSVKPKGSAQRKDTKEKIPKKITKLRGLLAWQVLYYYDAEILQCLQ